MGRRPPRAKHIFTDRICLRRTKGNRMSTSQLNTGELSGFAQPILGSALPTFFHRLREVRQEQGYSLRRIAQLMKVDVDQLRREEDPATDLPLSRLFAWQQVLEVPIADLLVESDAPLSAPVLQRARMVRLMKTVAAIQEKTDNGSVRRLAETMAIQLKEIMPELEGITAWQTASERRTPVTFGRAAHHYSTRVRLD
jgi:transcriptional regulator with XRE-family HTH domain